MSRSYPASTTPAVLPSTHYLRLPPPASMSSGSQQLRLCDQGVCKSDTAVEEVELLANVGTWLKQSTCATVSSSEQVTAASARRAMRFHTLDTAFALASALAHLCARLRLPFPTTRPHNDQVSLSDNVTAVLLPKHQLFAMPPANFAVGNGRCAPTPPPS
eukprot:scaffold28717_cov57-Phaeocystis_antarctica.AAC.4